MNIKSYSYQDIKLLLGEHVIIGDVNQIKITSLENIDTNKENAIVKQITRKKALPIILKY